MILTGALALLVSVNAAAAADWEALAPTPEPEAANPFSDLSSQQLQALRVIVLTRTLTAAGRALPDEARAELARANSTLQSTGLDANALLAQRDTLMAQRRRSAAVMPAVHGRTAQLAGYAIPIHGSGSLVTEFLLVPSPAMCSHATPPAANQVVHVHSPVPVAVDGPGTRLVAEGVLQIQAREFRLQFIDGPMSVQSGYSMSEARVRSPNLSRDQSQAEVK